jgi:predicted DsbA family dithiol-disulfide isomerase
MKKISLTYYSDVLCIWAYIAQARVDEIAHQFPDQVEIDFRFCSVFGDTANNIESAWRKRGGYAGFGQHVLDSVAAFPHLSVNPEIWQNCRPASSAPAHLILKSVQHIDKKKCAPILIAIREAFFSQCRDIAYWPVLLDIVTQAGISADEIQKVVDQGIAHAALEADMRDQKALLIQGSPSYILNDGRQKLYGNVGYSVIEANIKELLRSPESGLASWC